MIENFKLYVFRVVADTLNFTKAAEELHLSQPGVTSQVRSLEEGLGIALFDRVGRNATLIRIGMFLEVATILGALLGANLTTRISSHFIAIVFGTVLLYSAYSSFRGHLGDRLITNPNPLATQLGLSGAYLTPADPEHYHAEHVPLGFGIMFGAGTLSRLLGIGSGAVKVLAMDRAMGLPFKVSTTTSNFMIGVTAAASAGIYLAKGYVDAGIAMPVMLGVLLGSIVGSMLLVKALVTKLKVVLGLGLVAPGIEMIFSGLTGRI